MNDVYYPPVAFHFDVKITGGSSATPETDARFQEISGLDRELEVETLTEGGENRFTYQLPKRGKHPNLVLKRGLVSQGSDLAKWADETIGAYFNSPVAPRMLEVNLLDAQHKTLLTWTFTNAYPLKWVTSPLNSTESKILVESFELAYGAVERRGAPAAERVGVPPPPPPPRRK